MWCIGFLVLLYAGAAAAQQEPAVVPVPVPELLSDNVDSLIRDSLRKEFILSHRPLSAAELDRIVLTDKPGAYGRWVAHYLGRAGMLVVMSPAGQHGVVRIHNNREWIFYSFAFLFLMLGVLNRLFSGYLQKILRAYFNEGFIFKQARDQIMQLPQASLLFNFFSILTASLFTYFGLFEQGRSGPDRWIMIFVLAGFLILVYVVKLILMQIMGWIFSSKEIMENYVFVVFMNNKLIGILLLFSSFLMAFSERDAANDIFHATLYVAGGFFLFRFFKGFIIFSKQKGMGLLSLLLAFISLEILPSVLLIKFIVEEKDHLFFEWM